jgi:hypothetical protein
MASPTRLDAIVTHNSILRQLFRQAAAHQNISSRVRNLLEEPLRSHVQLGAIRDGTLVLTADSSAWAAKLRYQIPKLHRQMAKHSEFSNIQTIRVKVKKSSTERHLGKSRQALPMSRSTAEGLQRQAEALDDPALKNALLRLAERQRR